MNANIIVPVILFVLLAPGFIVALPPGASYRVQIFTHAAVFAVVYYFLRRTFPQYY